MTRSDNCEVPEDRVLKSFGMGLFTVLAGIAMASCASAQTSVGLNFYGAFNGTVSGTPITQHPSNAAGAMIEFRHISGPLLGFEATYSFNRANQAYHPYDILPPACPVGVVSCRLPSVSVPANAHALTLDWVPSVGIGNLRPFGIAGIGILVNEPAGGSNTTSKTTPVYVYGAGLDWGLLPHIGLRAQFREMTYKAPDLTTLYSSTGKFLNTAEPMVGAYFTF